MKNLIARIGLSTLVRCSAIAREYQHQIYKKVNEEPAEHSLESVNEYELIGEIKIKNSKNDNF